MKDLTKLDEFRVVHPSLGAGDKRNGAFKLNLPGSRLTFMVIASTGDGWEHVSVSAMERCPKWNEMQYVKDMFFEEDEAVFQLHPAKGNHINIHPNCLHLWRPLKMDIPLPPLYMV